MTRTIRHAVFVFVTVGVLLSLAFPIFAQARTGSESRLTTYDLRSAILRYRQATKKWPKKAADIRHYFLHRRYSETAFIEREKVTSDNLRADYRLRVSNGAQQETLRVRLAAPG